MQANKGQVVTALRELATLLEYHGESVFKVRAYETAAQALAAETSSLEKLLSDKDGLTRVRGIGKSIAEIIRETAEQGASPYQVQLRAGTPAGLFELAKVPGLGYKKIRLLFEQLGIATVEDLEREALAGTLADLPGFGKKTADKILSGIEQMKRNCGLCLYQFAFLAAAPLLQTLRAHPAVIRAEVAGSLRRGKEIVKDVDLVASSDRPEEVMEAFIASAGVSDVIARGSTKTTVRLDQGIQADLRVVPDSEFASALHHFTGSKDHNVQLRARAVSLGLRISEYGLFQEGEGGEQSPTEPAETPKEADTSRLSGAAASRRKRRLAVAGDAEHSTVAAAADVAKRAGERIPTLDETSLFSALGLSYIPPDLREGHGEIEAAARGEIPVLVELSDYRGVLHCHSTWSDGKHSIREMALAARDQWGWEYFAVCDHSEVASYAGGVRREDIPAQQAEIDELNDELSSGTKGGKFQILKGTECDILADGSLDYESPILENMDLVVASVHSRFQMSYEEMTARLIRAIENPYTTIIGHISGRLLLNREPYAFDMQKVLQRAAETGTIIEINADPRRLDLDWRYCKQAKEMGVMFSVNPDAHSINGLGYVPFGIQMARKGWLEKKDIINCLPLEEFLDKIKSLRAKKLAYPQA